MGRIPTSRTKQHTSAATHEQAIADGCYRLVRDVLKIKKPKKPRPRVPNCTRPKKARPGVCRYCGCVDADCRECVELTGEPCSWAGPSLCSACVTPELREERQALRQQLAEMGGES